MIMVMVTGDATPPTPNFERFDAKIAAGLRNLPGDVGGPPGCLGIRHVEVGPGLLRAEVDVHEELKTPFGNLHGGVLAALWDHCPRNGLRSGHPSGRLGRHHRVQAQLPGATTGTLSATARIVSLTQRTAVVRIDVVNEARLAGAARGTVIAMAPVTS
jgi:1,4-dihydroxy-2-naphthoyl-CoA hydrolase